MNSRPYHWGIFVFCMLNFNLASADTCKKTWEDSALTAKLHEEAAFIEPTDAKIMAKVEEAIKAAAKAEDFGKQVSEYLKVAENNAYAIQGNKSYLSDDVNAVTECLGLLKDMVNGTKMADGNKTVDRTKTVDGFSNNIKAIVNRAQSASDLYWYWKKKEANRNAKDVKDVKEAYKLASEAIAYAEFTFNWGNKSLKDSSQLSEIKDAVNIVQVYFYTPGQAKHEESGEIRLHRSQEYKLLTTMDRHPEVASLVGSPGVQFAADSSGGTTTITASLEQLGIGAGDRYKSITLSAPTSKSGNTNLATLDGLASAASIRLNFRWNLPYSSEQIATFGVAPQLGYQVHAYYATNTSITTSTTTDSPIALSAYGGFTLGKNVNQFVLIKAQFSEMKKDADTTTICPALSAPCIVGAFGEPKRKFNRVVSAEYRLSGTNWSIAPSLNYDNKVTGLDFPVYFIPTKKNSKPTGLTGGIDFGYRSDTHGSIGIFVGSTFDLFGVE